MSEEIWVPLSDYTEALKQAQIYKDFFFCFAILCGIFMCFCLFVLWLLLKKNKEK